MTRRARLRTLLGVSLVLSLAFSAMGADLAIVLEHEPHVGEEVVLSATSPMDTTLEWAVAGNVKPILLRGGGRECVFTPVDTQPVTVTATIRDRSGSAVGTAEQTLVPKEFDVVITVERDEPTVLWDPIGRKDTPVDALLASRPIRLHAALNPAFEGQHTFTWTVDASTAMVGEASGPGRSRAVIRRSQIGDSEISVVVHNAAGVRMGSGERTVSVTVPLSTLEESDRARGAWRDWQEAQGLWEKGQYAKAVELGQKASDAAPRDAGITQGFKSLSANYARLLRAEKLRSDAAKQRGGRLYAEALKNLRLAQVVWPTPEGERTIRDVEKESEEFHVLNQKATWLKDTAAAYDQEGFYEEALNYYAQANTLVSSDTVSDRMERIRNRLSLMADADRYASEGSALERDGQLKEAIDHYSASLVSNPDPALKQHLTDLQKFVSGREKRAASLYSEGMTLERKGKMADALVRYLESQRLWETPGAQDRVEELEKTTPKPEGTIRGPEDFGLFLPSEVEQTVRSADELYLRRRLDEAAALYRKGLKMAPDGGLKAWLDKVEDILRDQKAVRAANVPIREGNALYRAGKVKEAIAKYQESLKLHPNAEVEAFVKAHEAEAKQGK